MNLRAIYNKINCLCQSLLAPARMVTFTMDSETGLVAIGDYTDGNPAKAIYLTVPDGQYVELSNAPANSSEMSFAGAPGNVFYTFAPGPNIPATWTLALSASGDTTVTIIY